MSLTNATKQEVLDYLDENKVEIFLSYTEEYEGKDYDYWGVAADTGFSTFDIPMDESKAQFAGFLFHQLVNEHGMFFGDAEKLAQSYVETYRVMQEPMTEEEQEEIRQRMIDAIDSGNVKFIGDDNEQ